MPWSKVALYVPVWEIQSFHSQRLEGAPTYVCGLKKKKHQIRWMYPKPNTRCSKHQLSDPGKPHLVGLECGIHGPHHTNTLYNSLGEVEQWPMPLGTSCQRLFRYGNQPMIHRNGLKHNTRVFVLSFMLKLALRHRKCYLKSQIHSKFK